MWGWFGGNTQQKRKDSPKNAILGLRSQLDMLQKREKYLQSQIDEQDALARKHVNTNKNGMFRPPATSLEITARWDEDEGEEQEREHGHI